MTGRRAGAGRKSIVCDLGPRSSGCLVAPPFTNSRFFSQQTPSVSNLAGSGDSEVSQTGVAIC